MFRFRQYITLMKSPYLSDEANIVIGSKADSDTLCQIPWGALGPVSYIHELSFHKNLSKTPSREEKKVRGM